LGAEQVQTNGGSNDIHDAVDRAHFMKMHFLDLEPVNSGLGFREPAKDPQGQIALSLTDVTALQNLFDLWKKTVRLFVFSLNAYCRRRKTPFPNFLDLDLNGQAQGGDALDDSFGIHASVDKRGKSHIAANSAETVKVRGSHR
jgi:hypothetical protein